MEAVQATVLSKITVIASCQISATCFVLVRCKGLHNFKHNFLNDELIVKLFDGPLKRKIMRTNRHQVNQRIKLSNTHWLI